MVWGKWMVNGVFKVEKRRNEEDFESVLCVGLVGDIFLIFCLS